MENLFHMLTSSARIDKSKKIKKKEAMRKKKEEEEEERNLILGRTGMNHDGRNTAIKHDSTGEVNNDSTSISVSTGTSASISVSTDKKEFSAEKRIQIHRENMAAFRNSMAIKVSQDNRHDPNLPDPISSFSHLVCPPWWKETTPNNQSKNEKKSTFEGIKHSLLCNIETGKWINPTPIQMQAIPSLLARKDTLACAPTGSGKSGAFILPSLFLSGAPEHIFYKFQHLHDHEHEQKQKHENQHEQKYENQHEHEQKYEHEHEQKHDHLNHHHQYHHSKNTHNKTKTYNHKLNDTNQKNKIRALLLAPSRELASQLHREVERLGMGKPGGLRATLLERSNMGTVAAGKKGLDVLVSTPLRLVEAIEKHTSSTHKNNNHYNHNNTNHHQDHKLDLSSVRIVILDEADRLLDASDGFTSSNQNIHNSSSTSQYTTNKDGDDSDSHDSDNSHDDSHSDSHDSDNSHGDSDSIPSSSSSQKQQPLAKSGSTQSKTFLSQIDTILSAIPSTAVRALFSATIGPPVRHLAESILRDPIDISIGRRHKHKNSNANAITGISEHISQKLQFVGKEEGKLLAIRTMIRQGIKPPVMIFLQSQERAKALHEELRYEQGTRVDVVHAGRSRKARDEAVKQFRSGQTWILICTDLVARGVDFRAVNTVINYDLPTDGVSYIHRIGRTGRAGRAGEAITFFTEADFGPNLRTIANVAKLSGCDVPDWMLTLKHRLADDASSYHRANGNNGKPRRRRRKHDVIARPDIDTTPNFDKKKLYKRKQSIKESIKNKRQKN